MSTYEEDYDSFEDNDFMSTSEDDLDIADEHYNEKSDIRRVYDVEYRVLSVDDIRNMQESEANQVASILGIEKEHAATLLRHFKWNKDRLMEKYVDAPEAVLEEAGVITDIRRAPQVEPAPPGFCCDICYDDEPGMPSLALRCGHRFCYECYQEYVTSKIVKDGESRRIQCAASGCKVIVDEHTVMILTTKQVYER
jgi:ariadne-1